MAHRIELLGERGPTDCVVPLSLSVSPNHRLVLCHRLKSGIYIETNSEAILVAGVDLPTVDRRPSKPRPFAAFLQSFYSVCAALWAEARSLRGGIMTAIDVLPHFPLGSGKSWKVSPQDAAE